MIQWSYLFALCVSLAGLAVVDWRYRAAFWHDRLRTAKTLGAAIGIFIIWDILGILFGIFFHGGSRYSLPLRIFPEFPIEELFFLTLLTYTALLTYRLGARRWPRT